jgi:hypothetical protein
VVAIFFQIFLANIVLLLVLIAVHKFGHWLTGRVVGIPAGMMKIRLLTFPQQVVPSRGGRFLYVVGDSCSRPYSLSL